MGKKKFPQGKENMSGRNNVYIVQKLSLPDNLSWAIPLILPVFSLS